MVIHHGGNRSVQLFCELRTGLHYMDMNQWKQEFEVRDQINQEDAIIDNDMAETIMIIIAQEWVIEKKKQETIMMQS